MFVFFTSNVQEHGDAEEVSDPVPLTEAKNLFTACPPGGCTGHLSREQLAFHSKLHADLCVLVKKHDPPRNRPAADPLVIMWESASLAKTVSVLLAFRTMDSPMDMLFLRLGPNVGLIEEPPFSLRVQYYADRLDAAPLHDNDLAICAQLALEAGDWVIHRLELAGIDDDPSEFRIARKISYDAEHLQEEARQQKENNMAMRAFRLMERLKSGQKRQRRPRGPQPSTKKARQTAMPCDEQGELSPSRLSEESWSEDSEWAGSAGEEDQDPWMPLDLNLGAEKLDICGSDSAADVSAVGRGLPSSELGFKGSSTESSAGIAVDAASGRAVQSAKSKRVVQKRGVRWGPFLLSPIVPQGGQTGWGAICGLHHNRGDGSGSRCKKALSMGRLSHSACILRLKRWLLAGLNDAELSVQNARSDHVAMGGPGLQAFAEEGPSEEEMDEKIRQYTASSL